MCSSTISSVKRSEETVNVSNDDSGSNLERDHFPLPRDPNILCIDSSPATFHVDDPVGIHIVNHVINVIDDPSPANLNTDDHAVLCTVDHPYSHVYN